MVGLGHGLVSDLVYGWFRVCLGLVSPLSGLFQGSGSCRFDIHANSAF